MSRQTLGILNLCLVLPCVMVSVLNLSLGHLFLGVAMAILAVWNLACGLASLNLVFRD